MNNIYFRVFLAKLKMMLIYKKDFYTGLFSSVLKALVGILFIDFLFLNFDSIGDMSPESVRYLYFSVGFIQSISSLLFLGLVDFSNLYIKDGGLDIVLLKPVRKIPFIIAYDINIREVPNTVIHLFLLFISIKQLSLGFVNGLLLWIVPISGVIIFLSFCLMINCLSFKYKETLMAVKLVISLSDISRYPLKIYRPIIRVILTFVIPFGLTNYIPLSTINKLPQMIGIAFFVSILFLGVGYIMFEKSFHLYQSTGS